MRDSSPIVCNVVLETNTALIITSPRIFAASTSTPDMVVRKGKHDEKRGGKGGGDDPPMEVLKMDRTPICQAAFSERAIWKAVRPMPSARGQRLQHHQKMIHTGIKPSIFPFNNQSHIYSRGFILEHFEHLQRYHQMYARLKGLTWNHSPDGSRDDHELRCHTSRASDWFTLDSQLSLSV
ncbi:uncharacterized protein BDZ99DRAFT_263649 [Mytilinidion resinicola]|uniref:Uncharacterized protein n=1 Tax=Mytilinidion resinicola TaxID=574789 RepID=A0A6A6YUN8_9PEZI|nr:uncharacterized protein BDZ99DRAFT_263649 [Mytilinidion resinicola]KAF2812258.1 hypothetical protein BDZ99DRAFT_263649 [Mytilinidion resinicola]